MTLVSHLHDQNWSALEDAWTELMLADGDLDEVFTLLDLAEERRQMAQCVPHVREHADLLAGSGRPREAAEMLGRTMLGGGSPGELSKALWLHAHAAFSEESWWENFSELSGLRENAPDMRAAWADFRKLLALREGAAVYHAKGWGIGAVTNVDLEALDIEVRFRTGRRDRIPFRSAIDIFEVLAPDDLRSIVANDPDELKRRLKDEPLEVLRAVLKRYQGRATYPLLKTSMAQLSVDGSAFTSWWRRTRKQAETSQWFEVSGAGTKATVRMLVSAADPAENLRRQLRQAPSLRDVRLRVNEMMSGGDLIPELREVALETLENLAADDTTEGSELSERLAAWVFLREEHKVTPPPMAERLREAAEQPDPDSPSEPPALWSLLQLVPNARDQERTIELLRELYGDEGWLDIAAKHLPHCSPGMVRGLIEALLAAGRASDLAGHYNFLMARQTLNPHLLIGLAEQVEAGTLEGKFPPPLRRVQALIQLSTQLLKEKTPAAIRARTRLTAMLTTGKPPLLRRLLGEVDRAGLKSTLALVERGVDDAIESVFTYAIVDLAPDIFRAQNKPFWEEGRIWSTRAGLMRREGELRELTDVKIPANAEAIGKAASLGDLSENSEWESALEEQRNLTTRASQIEAEVKNAAVIEDAAIPEDTACPGTRVRYRETATGEELEVVLLGPWDTYGDDNIISYRSPLATGLLGLHVGESAELDLPSGTIHVEVLEIEPYMGSPEGV